MNKYYTYAYLREDGTPYYIGKGQSRRAYDRKKHRVSIPSVDRILILKSNLTEQEAFKHEIYMISLFGRKDLRTGILLNMTGGGEGTSGYRHTSDRKDKIRQKQLKRWTDEEKTKIKGDKNSFYGKKHTEDTKKRIGILSKKRNQGCNNPRAKSWNIIFENGEKIITNCLSTWCKDNGYKFTNVYNVHKKLSKNHKGIIFVGKI